MYMLSVSMYTATVMAATLIRHKHLRIDQAKLDKARKILAVDTDTEALDRALALVVSEAEVDAALRSVARKGRIKKVFR
jgi:chemotaxis methyl-accepting protein methylase